MGYALKVNCLVPQKGKGKRPDNTYHAVSGNTVDLLDGLLEVGRASKKMKISKDNAIPQFKQIVQALASANNDEAISEAVKDMERIIHSLIKDSTGDSNYDQALEQVGVMREQMFNYEMPELYNRFLRDLKIKIKSGALGDGRKDLWWRIRYPGTLGLITKDQLDPSNVTAEEAKKVCVAREYMATTIY